MKGSRATWAKVMGKNAQWYSETGYPPVDSEYGDSDEERDRILESTDLESGVLSSESEEDSDASVEKPFDERCDRLDVVKGDGSPTTSSSMEVVDVEAKVEAIMREVVRKKKANMVTRLKATVASFTKAGRVGEDRELGIPLEEKIEELCRDVWVWGEEELDEWDAVDWAEGFEIPGEVVSECERELMEECQGDFETLVRKRNDVVKGDRLSIDRVQDLVSPDNPDRLLMEELAVEGMDLCLPEEYVSNSVAPCGIH
jgi:hypothetical protein